jgi:uncharacterized protein (DUF4415 family)
MKKSSGSCRHGKPRRLSAGSITMTDELKAELASTNKPDDQMFELAEMPEVLDWSEAVRGKFYRPIKKPISIRLDADVLAWFQSLGGKYQVKINEALREYMQQHRKARR